MDPCPVYPNPCLAYHQFNAGLHQPWGPDAHQQDLIADVYPLEQCPALQYPTSSARDEPIVRRTNPRHATLLAPSSPSASSSRRLLAPEYEQYLPSTLAEVCPGVRADGVLSARHPCVAAFLAKLPKRTALDDRAAPKPLSLANTELFTVHGVLGIELEDDVSECLFALSALEVARWYAHPAHFALWGRHVRAVTAQRVQRVMDRTPRPIVTSTVWYGVKDQLRRLVAAHGFLRSKVDPESRGQKRTRSEMDAADARDEDDEEKQQQHQHHPRRPPPQPRQQTQAGAKRRRGPLLTRRKGARHAPSRTAAAKAPAVIESESESESGVEVEAVVEVVDEVGAVVEERPTKRARTEAHDSELAEEAPSAPSRTTSATLEPTCLPLATPAALDDTQDAATTTPAPAPGPARRSARLVPVDGGDALILLRDAVPPGSHLTALVDASNRRSVASDASSSATCVQDVALQPDATGKTMDNTETPARTGVSGTGTPPRRSSRPHKPKIAVDMGTTMTTGEVARDVSVDVHSDGGAPAEAKSPKTTMATTKSAARCAAKKVRETKTAAVAAGKKREAHAAATKKGTPVPAKTKKLKFAHAKASSTPKVKSSKA